MYIFVAAVRILVYFTLAVSFLFGLEQFVQQFRELSLLSAINFEFLICNKEVLLEYEEQHRADLSEEDLLSYDSCLRKSEIIAWVMFFPCAVFQIYTLCSFMTIRDNLD